MALEVTFREYDADRGIPKGNIRELNFGTILPGQQSSVKAMDLAITGVRGVSNLKASVTDPGIIPLVDSADSVTSSSGHFGIETSSSLTEKPDLIQFFGYKGAQVPVSMRSAYESNYIYLTINPGHSEGEKGTVDYTFQFDFVDAVEEEPSSSSSSQVSSSSSSSYSTSSNPDCRFNISHSGTSLYDSQSFDVGDNQFVTLRYRVLNGSVQFRVSVGGAPVFTSACHSSVVWSEQSMYIGSTAAQVEVFGDCLNVGDGPAWEYELACYGYSSSSSSNGYDDDFGDPCGDEIPPYGDLLPAELLTACGYCQIQFTYQTFWVKDQFVVVSSNGDDLILKNSCGGGQLRGKLLYDSGCLGTETVYGGPHTVYINVSPIDFPLTVELVPRCSGTLANTRWWATMKGCGVDLDVDDGNNCGKWEVQTANIVNNVAPQVGVLADQVVEADGGSATAILSGSVTDDGNLGPMITRWQFDPTVSADVAIADDEAQTTTVTFTNIVFNSDLDVGFKLRAYDGQLYDEQSMTVTIIEPTPTPTPPTPTPTPTPCGQNPPVLVTVTWTDSDVTKSIWGETFTKGESKYVCPTLYGCNNSDGTGPLYFQNHEEYWWFDNSPTSLFLYAVDNVTTVEGTLVCHRQRNSLYAVPPGASLNVYKYLTTSYMTATTYSGTMTLTSNISTENFNAAAWSLKDFIPDHLFGQLTTTDGVTITWQRTIPSYWNPCSLS